MTVESLNSWIGLFLQSGSSVDENVKGLLLVAAAFLVESTALRTEQDLIFLQHDVKLTRPNPFSLCSDSRRSA